MSTTALQRHLLTVWNPSYEKAGVEEHLAILLKHARAGVSADAYVWWGKVRSKNRRDQEKLPHDDVIDEIALELEYEPDREAHLYITDYQSLYVGHIKSIERSDVRLTDPTHVPAYYEKFDCDCWFKLLDIQRIVSRDLDRVIQELKLLHNVHYDNKSVSLYGGMHNFPLVVTRESSERFFGPEERSLSTDSRLWAELDAERAGSQAVMEAELRDNLLGAKIWNALNHQARAFLAAGENAFRSHRIDPGFDFSPVIVQFAKAMEVECNARIATIFAASPVEKRAILVNGKSLDLLSKSLSLGTIAIGLEQAIKRQMPDQVDTVEWFTDAFAKFLDRLSKLRNKAAHNEAICREDAIGLRDELLGVGTQGILAKLVNVRLKAAKTTAAPGADG